MNCNVLDGLSGNYGHLWNDGSLDVIEYTMIEIFLGLFLSEQVHQMLKSGMCTFVFCITVTVVVVKQHCVEIMHCRRGGMFSWLLQIF